MLKLVILVSMILSTVLFVAAAFEFRAGQDSTQTFIVALIWAVVSNMLRLNRLESKEARP